MPLKKINFEELDEDERTSDRKGEGKLNEIKRLDVEERETKCFLNRFYAVCLWMDGESFFFYGILLYLYFLVVNKRRNINLKKKTYRLY